MSHSIHMTYLFIVQIIVMTMTSGNKGVGGGMQIWFW